MPDKSYLPTYDVYDIPRKRLGLINLSVFNDRLGLKETSNILAHSAKKLIDELFKTPVSGQPLIEPITKNES